MTFFYFHLSASFGTMTRSVSGKRGNIGEVKLKSSPTKYVTPDASPRRERWKKAPFRQSPGGGPSFFDLYSNVAEQQPENLGNVTTGCKTIRSKVPAALGQCDEDTTTRELGVAEAEVGFPAFSFFYLWTFVFISTSRFSFIAVPSIAGLADGPKNGALYPEFQRARSDQPCFLGASEHTRPGGNWNIQ